MKPKLVHLLFEWLEKEWNNNKTYRGKTYTHIIKQLSTYSSFIKKHDV